MKVQYKKLDIGCGASKCESDATGIDIAPGPGVDLVGDALLILQSMEANSVGSIYSSHFLEHHDNPAAILKEMVRVVIPGGQIEIRVPHFSDPWFYSDPTHKHMFGLYTFCYYFAFAKFQRKVPNYALIEGAQIQYIYLKFGSTRPFYLRHAFKKVLQFFVNLSHFTLELYEELFSKFLPCSEIRVLIVKDESVNPTSPTTLE
ncbi:MAG TPA: methyltransferase domain-containing protein [Burkholderiaceae bacterium]|nr:methyltransferase domain-containing protein [Burkholderiaceae bacterium]